MSSLDTRKLPRISRFAENDLPEPEPPTTNIFKFPRDRDSLISYIKKFIDEKKEYQKQRSRRIDAFSEAASTLNDKSIPSFKKFISFKELMEVFVEEIYWCKIIYNQIQIMIY